MRVFKKWIGCPLVYNLFTTLWNGTRKMWRHYVTSLTTSPTFAGLTSASKQRDFLSKTIFVNCDVCVWLNKSYCFHTGRWTLSSRRSQCDSGLDIFEEKIFPHFFSPEELVGLRGAVGTAVHLSSQGEEVVRLHLEIGWNSKASHRSRLQPSRDVKNDKWNREDTLGRKTAIEKRTNKQTREKKNWKRRKKT